MRRALGRCGMGAWRQRHLTPLTHKNDGAIKVAHSPTATPLCASTLKSVTMTVKTVLATGASSGIVRCILFLGTGLRSHRLIALFSVCLRQGFEVVKQLLAQTQQPYRFILGCRDPAAAQSAFDALSYDTQTHAVDVLPLELNNLKTVKSFASEAWQQLEENGQSTPLDYLLMNAGLAKAAKEPSPTGSKWCEAYVVNHLCMHC